MHSINNIELSSLEETRCQFNGGRCAIKLGIDVHQDFYVVVEQVEGSNPKPPQRFAKEGKPSTSINKPYELATSLTNSPATLDTLHRG
jgi:hypothetical protein